jgi:hypothetical protein
MKYLILSTIFLTALISLCTMPNIELPVVNPTQTQQLTNVLTVDSGSPDIFIGVDISTSQTKPNREFQISFELRDKQSFDLRDAELTVYDHPCFRDEDNPGLFSKIIGTIRANQTKMFNLKWKTDPTIDLQKNCPIRFKISYYSDYSFFQNIVVLSSSEYYQKESEGTLKNIPITFSSTSSPLGIQITFSDEQPFLENQPNYYMYINYFNSGQGYFEDVDAEISPPSNINLDCSPVYDSNFKLDKVNHPLVFIRDRATPSTCKFSTKDVATMDIKSLSLTAKYKYILDNSISITVKP